MIMFMEIITIKSSIHNYNVILHDKLEELLKNELDSSKKSFVVIDEVLFDKYSPLLKEIIKDLVIFPVKASEETKGFKQYEILCKELLKHDFSKNDCVISFGGGTISDLAGYLASSYKRGIELVIIPTTTLSMVDASIGGKNAINVGDIKNAVGSIYPPSKVLIGLDVLETLSVVDYANGICESLKMGVTLNKNLFNLFEKETLDIKETIKESLLTKKMVVEKDELESGFRKVLNFGHTIGHAIEFESNYKIKHGFAIANGMLIASKDTEYYENLKKILKKIGCPIITNIDVAKLMEAIKNDKKASSGGIDFVLAPEIGKYEIKHVSFNYIKGVIENYVI